MFNYLLVAIDSPFNSSILTYSVKEDESSLIKSGTIVKVPLGKREVLGCVLQKIKDNEIDIDCEKIKTITSIEESLSVSLTELELYKWMSSYYHYPLGQLIFDVFPKTMKKPRKLNSLLGKNENFSFELTGEQKHAVEDILKENLESYFKRLIHGVTGAGKTIVYLTIIKKIIEMKKSVLFLLPEINLTPQFLDTFEKYLGVAIYSYNSSISQSDRYGLWKLLQEDNEPKLIVGVRSSIFLPIKNLGLIIVDEEHDQSFKQDDRCTYNARDVAIKKATIEKIPVLLGSATPMIETFKNFKESNNYLKLEKRAMNASLPEIEFIDMKGKLRAERDKEFWPLSAESIVKIKAAFNKNEQVLIFINRLGYSNYLQCNSCGHQFTCLNCTTNLKFFKKRSELSCQTCEFKSPVPEMCPECMNIQLSPKGFGTEKVFEVVEKLFPDKQIARFDRDEIKNFKKLEETLSAFHSKKIDMLVGTQMLSKGHNFENVNLVLILGIDSQLNFPDFRSNERVYQTLTQVSGRAGRFGKKASVVIHTLSPENKIFSYVKTHSFDEFYKDELELRKLCSSPPYKKVALIYFSSKSQLKLIEEITRETDKLKSLTNLHFAEVDVLGPRPSMIEKKANQFTWSIMIRSSNLNQLHNLINTFKKNYSPEKSISLKIDIDPYYFD